MAWGSITLLSSINFFLFFISCTLFWVIHKRKGNTDIFSQLPETAVPLPPKKNADGGHRQCHWVTGAKGEEGGGNNI